MISNPLVLRFKDYLALNDKSDIYKTNQTNFINKLLKKKDFTLNNVREYILQAKNSRNRLSACKNYAKFLFEENLIEEKEFNSILRLQASNKYIPNHLKPKEEQRAYAIPHERWSEIYSQIIGTRRFVVWICFNFGLRIQEALHLAREDIQLEEKLLYIRPKNDWKTKTGTSIRQIPISSKQELIFREYFEKKGEINGYLFTTKEGNVVNYRNFTKELKDVKIEIDGLIKKFSLHNARRSYASYVYFQTGDLYITSKLLGHSTVAVTQRYLMLEESTLIDKMKTTLAKLDF